MVLGSELGIRLAAVLLGGLAAAIGVGQGLELGETLLAGILREVVVGTHA